MITRTLRVAVFGLVALLSLFAINASQAQLPPSANQIMITQPGTYVLNRGVRVNGGNAIVIRSSNVTLDLNGHTVTTTSPATAPATTVGILVQSTDGSRLSGVTVKNGKVSGFSQNVSAVETQGLVLSDLQIVGEGAAPNGGPTEVGINLINARGAKIKHNTINSVNLGIFLRGNTGVGNTITDNTVLGGPTAANNLLGVCWNPLPQPRTTDDGPTGDLFYNNHVSRFGFAIALSNLSRWNVIRDNTLISFNGGFREPQNLTTGGGTNVAEDNIQVTIPATNL